MYNEHPNQVEKPLRSRIGTVPLVLALFCLGGVAAGIWIKDRQEIDTMSADRAQMAANLNQSLVQSKSQVQELNSRLDALMVAQARAQAPVVKTAPHSTKKGAARRKPLVANDPRVDKLQGQLTDTQQEL